MNRRAGWWLVGGLVLALALASLPALARAARSRKPTAVQYHDAWRVLWEDHISWTRSVIMGVLDELPGTNAYINRLIRNYADMEDALKPFYGDEAEQLGDLIQEHLNLAVDLLTAAKAGDTAAFDAAVAAWYENADQIAARMAAMNPRFWPEAPTKQMWRDHLDATLAEAVAHLTGDAEGEVAAFDMVHALALQMADFFSAGVIRQFPSGFRRNGGIRA